MLAITTALLAGKVALGINISDSVDTTLFIIPKEHPENLARGHYVAFHHDGSPWGLPANTLWVKQVVGLPGDSVHVDRDYEIHVANTRIGKLSKDSMRRGSLTPITTGQVPPNTIFVIGEHANSLDSRYAEFGYVPFSAITGRALPLF